MDMVTWDDYSVDIPSYLSYNATNRLHDSLYASIGCHVVLSYDELEEYVRCKIMDFVDEGLTKQMVLRIKGLRYGQYMANNNAQKHSSYSFKTILLTFKACYPKIKSAISTKQFKNNMQKFNYIMAIVENNIVDVSQRMRRAEEERARSEAINHDIAQNSNVDAIYEHKNKVAKSNKKQPRKNRFSNLW